MTALRPELEALPPRLRHLPVDDRGYPVPWFVAWVEGKPEFRAMDPDKWRLAVRHHLCWVCGEALGVHLSFLIGPMCGVNRTTSEPPSHRGCAQWSARNCPFLSRPHMVRREDELTQACEGNVAGEMIRRNPGVSLLWNCLGYRLIPDGRGRPLIRIGAPESVEWWSAGRHATRAEVEESVSSGLPALLEMAAAESTDAIGDLMRRVEALQQMYPAA
jgi:hypothetical protein